MGYHIGAAARMGVASATLGIKQGDGRISSGIETIAIGEVSVDLHQTVCALLGTVAVLINAGQVIGVNSALWYNGRRRLSFASRVSRLARDRRQIRVCSERVFYTPRPVGTATSVCAQAAHPMLPGDNAPLKCRCGIIVASVMSKVLEGRPCREGRT